MGFFILLSIIILLAILLIVNVRKRNAKKKEYGASEGYVCIHMYGVPHLPESVLVDLFVTDEHLIIESNKIKFQLSLDNLTAAEFLRKTDLLKKDKSVIGRGVVGGVVLGPLGAIVGGMSGVGEKHNKGNYIVLNYRSSEEDEIKVMIFDLKNILNAQKLARLLDNHIISKKTKDGIVQL